MAISDSAECLQLLNAEMMSERAQEAEINELINHHEKFLSLENQWLMVGFKYFCISEFFQGGPVFR
jgi:hypothetical protein